MKGTDCIPAADTSRGPQERWRRVTRGSRLAAIRLAGYDAFISHKHADGASYAQELFEELERWGYTVCLDSADFQLAGCLSKALQNVKRSRLLIVLDTRLARESEWVAREIEFAVERRIPIARICLGTAEAIERTATPPDWPLLTDAQAAYLREAISCREPGGAEHVTTAIASKLLQSLSAFTARRRLATAVALLILAASLVAAAYAVRRTTEWRIQSARWRIQQPGRSFHQQIGEAVAFVSSTWAPLAQWFHPDAFDDAYEDLRERTLMHGDTVPVDNMRVAATSTDGRVTAMRTVEGRVTLRGSTNDACVMEVPDEATIAVAPAGKRLVAVQGHTLVTYRIGDCQRSVLSLERLHTTGTPPSSIALSDDGDVAVLAWPRVLGRVTFDDGPRVTDTWTPPPSTAEEPADLVRAWISHSGKVVAVALGALEQANQFMLASEGLQFRPSERALTLTDIAFDSTDTFVVTAEQTGYLRVWRIQTVLTKHPRAEEFKAEIPADQLRVPVSGRTLLTLSRAGQQGPAAAGLVTAWDLPTLTPLGRTFLRAAGGTFRTFRMSGGFRAPRLAMQPEWPAQPPACASAMAVLRSTTPSRPPVLDYTRARLLGAGVDCGILVIGGDPDDPSLIEVFVRTGAQSGSAYHLRHRRRAFGDVHAVRLPADDSLGVLRVQARFDKYRLSNSHEDTLVTYDLPLSRRALAAQLLESDDDTAAWSFPLPPSDGHR